MSVKIINASAYWARVVQADGCWGWTGFIDNKGYPRLNVQQMRPRSQGAHRVSWALHHGEVPHGAHILHNCDNPVCTNPAHLRIGTHQDNMRDMKERGRVQNGMRGKTGELCCNAKLTWEQVREIRRLGREGRLSQNKIAALIGTTRANVGVILRGETWPEAT